jgi:hypothetical protein
MIPGNNHLRPLSDDVTAQPNPRPTDQFQPEPDRLAQRAGDALGQARWLEHDEEAAGPTSERGETMEAIRHSGRPSAGCSWPFRTGVFRPEDGGQVNEEEVHRPTLQQGAGDAETLVQRLRRQDDEPLQPNAARDGLDGIEGAGEIQVGDDRATNLRLRGQGQRESGLAAGCVAVHGDARKPRDPARPQDRVQRREPGMDDPPIVDFRRALRRPIVERTGGGRQVPVRLVVLRKVQWDGRERPDRGRLVALCRQIPRPRSCRTPASLEGRESGSDLG